MAAIPKKSALRWFTTGFVMITSTSLFLYHKNDPLLWRRMNDYLNRRLKTPLILNSIPMRHVPMTYNGMLEEAFTKHWNIHAFFYLRVAMRFLQLALYFTPLLLAYPISRLFGQSGRRLQVFNDSYLSFFPYLSHFLAIFPLLLIIFPLLFIILDGCGFVSSYWNAVDLRSSNWVSGLALGQIS